MVCTRKSRRLSLREVDESSSARANLPSQILMEIISWLPIKAVMAVRCVSKSLLKLVSEPYFKELYSTRAPTELFLCHYKQKNILYIAEPVFHDDYPVAVAVDMKFSLVLDLPNFSVGSKNDLNFKATRGPYLVNSCNGLVCFYGPRANKFAVICNPVTGEYVTIPGPDRKDKTIIIHSILYGLGFSSKDNRFKLLRMFWRRSVDAGPLIRDRRCRMFSEIYTFGEGGSWKSVENCPDVSWLSQNCLFFQGVLHWYLRSSGDIVTFDLDNDKFGKIKPPYIWAREMERGDFSKLGVLGDCLYKTATVGDCVEIWVMKEYGVQSSWIKAFSIQKHIWYSSQNQIYKPIKYLQNEEILMLSGCKIVCYNQDTGSIRIIGSISYSGGYENYEAIYLRPSLVSLKVLLGDNVKARNAKSRCAHKKLREVDVTSCLTRIRLVEDTERRLRLLQEEERAHRDKEEHTRGDPEVYLRQVDYLQRQIQELMKLLHLCRDIPPQTAAEPPPAATNLVN